MAIPLTMLGWLDFLNGGNVWVLIPLTGMLIPIIAIVIQPFQQRIKSAEREKLRQMYERLALEKLDVIKTAVSMGYKQTDLAELDSRLEQVIGSAAMQRVLEGKSLGTGSSSLPVGSPAGDEDEADARSRRRERERSR